ncbi:hypothetical protein J1N35_034490 [Gossypium stocksii]|uniref:Uncharacterized protein n=1 Tax=Gossypium stocksii TaxID=47602 RepID=A0A9D3ZQR6_9ROSI|nr:hypothetical protein J1N35_034490 [Gossypium stocksii]
MANVNMVGADLANLQLSDEEEDPLVVEGVETRIEFGYKLCLDVVFGLDISLRATPRRGGQIASKWLREESNNDRWARMDIECEEAIRKSGNDVTN